MLAQNPTLIGPATPATNLMGNPMAPGEIDWRDTLKSAFGVAAAAASASSGGGSYQIITKDLDVTLRALATVGKLNVLSRPSILARNNEQAYIQIGESVPLVSNTRIGTNNDIINTSEYRDTGIILQVTPHISAEGLVEMVIDGDTGISSLNRSAPLQITSNVFAYPITNRLVNTSVIVPDGMTVVIGGLMRDEEADAISKIPILGDVPWAGTLFRRTIKTKQKTELIIFLTPHVVEKTPRLETLSVAEMSKTELAPTAFTGDEMNRHLDNWQTLAPRPKPPALRAGFWKRTLAEVRSAVSIFR
jgi:general secretion pathway protein D